MNDQRASDRVQRILGIVLGVTAPALAFVLWAGQLASHPFAVLALVGVAAAMGVNLVLAVRADKRWWIVFACVLLTVGPWGFAYGLSILYLAYAAVIGWTKRPPHQVPSAAAQQ